MHTPFPIRNDADYARALDVVGALWDAEPGTPDADALEVMATLVAAWEGRRRELPAADPLKLISFKLRELGWTQRELARRLGWGSGRVSEILSAKRPLTLRMVRDLSAVLDLPPGLLVHDTREDDLGGAWVRLTPGTTTLVRQQLGADSVTVGELVDQIVREALGATGLVTVVGHANDLRGLVTLEPGGETSVAPTIGARELWKAAAA